MDVATGRALEIKKQHAETAADPLYPPLRLIVESYLHLEDDKRQDNTYPWDRGLTLFENISRSYATKIAHNLLWHIDIENTLKFAAEHQEALSIELEIKDPHGQRVKGTPLQILYAAGDRNPIEVKDDPTESKGDAKESKNDGIKDYGLVERLRHCFTKNPKDYYDQIAEWKKRGKEQTERRMARLVEAIKTLCQEIMSNKDIADDKPYNFKALLNSPLAKKLRDALTPDPNDVLTAGLLFDLQIFLDFIKIWKDHIDTDKAEDKELPTLGDWGSRKSKLFAAIVYPALQARVQRIDLEVLNKGIANVIDEKQLPDRLDFSNGLPVELTGLGDSLYLAHYGYKYDSDISILAARILGPWFQNLCQTKTSDLPLQAHVEQTNMEPVSDDVGVRNTI